MPKRTPEQHSREIFSNTSTVLVTGFGDTASLDAFGRQRVANPESLFDTSFEYDLMPLLWQMKTTGSGSAAHDSDARMATLSVGGSTGLVKGQTYSYFPYQKGKSQRFLMTFVLGTVAGGIRRRVGYFDDSDGIFLEQTFAGLFLVLRSSTSGAIVDTRIAQSDWNQDPFDGTGSSGITIDVTRRQILDADIEWLGVGRVRFGFNIDGKTVYAHYINNANIGAAAPYMRTGTLPLRYEIENTGAGSAATLSAICSSVFSEGGFEKDRGVPFSASRGDVAASVGARVPVLSIRPKATFNSIENRGQITPLGVNIFTTSQSVFVEIVYNGLLFGTGAFVSVADESVTEYNVAATVISGGYTLQAFYVPVNGSGNNARGDITSPILSRLPLTLDIDGANPIPLSIVCTPLSGTASVLASLNENEVR